MSETLKVYLIAGEPSGDLLGSRLMRALKKQTQGRVQFFGVGGETMIAEGLESLFDIRDLAVMGFFEVVPSIPKILKHLDEIVADIQLKDPDIVMTIDSYSFSARVHKKLKSAGYEKPHVHCVAPQVWAWKKGRAKKIGQFVDHLFCLLPNEAKYFEPYGMETTFIGHPVVEGGADRGKGDAFRQRYGISRDATVLCLLPGSRKNEIKYLLPVFRESVEQLRKYVPNLFVVIPTVKTVSDRLLEQLKNWSVPHLIITGEKERYDAFGAADLALAASGTVSVELAMAGVPHLIAYKVSPLTGAIARRLLKIRFVNLLNILADEEIIPELLQENCTVDKVVETLRQLLAHPEQATRDSLRKLGLGNPSSPSDKLAEELQKIAKRRKK
ncbi:MAG: lipid-A-disaccharide synthase [Alphaproteobacteria bacterium]|nr:lipid-A-disaccharide synthase [Alphaproteobacteria bacterium]